jgi:hypothetical protein
VSPKGGRMITSVNQENGNLEIRDSKGELIKSITPAEIQKKFDEEKLAPIHLDENGCIIEEVKE